MLLLWHLEKKARWTLAVAESWVPGMVIIFNGVLSGISLIQSADPSTGADADFSKEGMAKKHAIRTIKKAETYTSIRRRFLPFFDFKTGHPSEHQI